VHHHGEWHEDQHRSASFSASSSDPGNALGFAFVAGDYDYTPDRVGVDFGGNGVLGGGDDTFYTSGPSSQLVDAIYSRGSGNAFESLSTDPGATDQDRLDIVASSVGSFTFTGMYSLELRVAAPVSISPPSRTGHAGCRRLRGAAAGASVRRKRR